MGDIRSGQRYRDTDSRQYYDVPGEMKGRPRVIEIVNAPTPATNGKCLCRTIEGKKPGRLTEIHEGTLRSRRYGRPAFELIE